MSAQRRALSALLLRRFRPSGLASCAATLTILNGFDVNVWAFIGMTLEAFDTLDELREIEIAECNEAQIAAKIASAVQLECSTCNS